MTNDFNDAHWRAPERNNVAKCWAHDLPRQLTEKGVRGDDGVWNEHKKHNFFRLRIDAHAPRVEDGVDKKLRKMYTVEFVRFRTTQTRHPGCGELQMAQLIVFDVNGTSVPLTDACNPGGHNPPGEDPAKALDGTPKTKWLDAHKGALECRLAMGAAMLGKYMLVTANDCPERDPVRWVLEGSSIPICMQVLTTAPAPPLPTGGCSRDGVARPIRGVSSMTRAARISRCPTHGLRCMRSCFSPRAAISRASCQASSVSSTRQRRRGSTPRCGKAIQ